MTNEATCRTCGATGPPWQHKPSFLDPDGVGDPGHRIEVNDLVASEGDQGGLPCAVSEASTDVANPPDGCICASFWTIRQQHKADCPLAPPPPDTLDTILINYRIDLPDEALSHRAEYGEQEDTARNKAKAQLLDWKKHSEQRAIEIHDLQQHIENLDIQCEEGNCKNCDSKRPKLKELEAALQKKLQGDVTL